MQKGIFSQNLDIKSRTVNNAIIQLGDIDDTGKGRKFKSRFIKDGLVKIEGHGIVLLKKETLDKSLKTMIGSPVIIEHQDVTDKNADKIRCGVISDAYFNEPDGWYYAEGIIWDDKAQNLINDGWSVSCSYDFLAFNDEGGEENNIKYDKEFTELNFTHLAIVNNPRYERANIVFNSKVKNSDNKNGRWITVKGTHIFIKDGQSLTDAMREKGMDVKQKYSDESGAEDVDWSEEGLYKSIKEAQEDGLTSPEDIADYLGLDEDEVREALGSQVTYQELKEKLDYYKKRALEEGSSFFTKQIIEGLQQKIDEMRNSPANYVNERIKRLKQRNNNKANNSQDNIILNALKNLITTVENNKDDDNGKWVTIKGNHIFIPEGKTLDEVIKEKGWGDKDYKSNEDEEYRYDAKQLTYGKQYLPKDYQGVVLTFIGEDNGEAFFREGYDAFDREAKKVSFKKGTKFASHDTGSSLGKGIDPLPNYMTSYGSEFNKLRLQYIKEHGKPSEYENKNINNSKEQDMAILEELKKLISKVENNKENEEMIDNEKVDKRKLIDEVGGILKGKVDDEIIRTIIKKMEEASYNDSEASADNKKVKNEDDEEEKKVDNEEEKDEKVDNEEDDKKEDDKVDNEEEEDEEKVEELKKEEKKDVANKCKNSKETSTFDKINAIYNSVRALKPKANYVTRQEKLDNAVEYFKN